MTRDLEPAPGCHFDKLSDDSRRWATPMYCVTAPKEVVQRCHLNCKMIDISVNSEAESRDGSEPLLGMPRLTRRGPS